MPTETIAAPTSQEPSAKAPAGDAKKSDNVKGPSVAHALLQREAALITKQAPPAESITEAAKAAEKVASPTATDAPVTKEASVTEPAKEPEAKAPATEADDPDVLSKIPPEIQKSIDKRIGKEMGKREALEAKVAELEKKLAEKPVELPKPAPIEPTASNPLANIVDLATLEKQVSTAKETKLWVQEQLDREDIEQGVKVGDRTYTKQELKTALRNVERQLDIHIPERAKFLQLRAEAEKRALDSFEWLKDKDSEQFKMFQKLMNLPDAGFATSPYGVYSAAAAVEGQSQVTLRQSIAKDHQGAKPVEKKAPPASQIASSGASVPPARESGSNRAVAALAEEMAQMKKGHGVKVTDVTKFLARRDQTHR